MLRSSRGMTVERKWVINGCSGLTEASGKLAAAAKRLPDQVGQRHKKINKNSAITKKGTDNDGAGNVSREGTEIIKLIYSTVPNHWDN